MIPLTRTLITSTYGSSKGHNVKRLPHLVCWTTLVQLTLSDFAVVCAPPGLVPSSPLSPTVAMSIAPSCVCADVSLHPIVTQCTVTPTITPNAEMGGS